MKLSLYKDYKTGQLELQCDHQMAEPENGVFEACNLERVIFNDTDITEIIDDLFIMDAFENLKNKLFDELN